MKGGPAAARPFSIWKQVLAASHLRLTQTLFPPRNIPNAQASCWQESWNVMNTSMPDPSTRRVLWWARSFGRPLQTTFAPANDETPEELSELLELADKRLNSTRPADER